MRKLLLFILVLSTTQIHAATRTALATGNWFTAATWSGNTVPAANDIVIIPAGIIVTLVLPSTSTVNTPWNNPGSIKVYGTFELTGTDPLFSNPAAIEIFSGGNLHDNTDFGEYYLTQISTIKVYSGAIYSGGTNFINSAVPGSVTGHYQIGQTSTNGPFTITVANNIVTLSNVALSLSLLSFTAHEAGSSIELSWQTANEKNTAGFDIERSADGASYQSIGNVPVKGPSANLYTSIDPAPLNGNNFYRLKMMDVDDKYTYSAAVKIDHLVAGNEWSMYPVPALNTINVNTNETGMLSIYSSDGRLVKTVTLTAGKTTLDISSLSDGLYHSILNGDKQSFIKAAIH